MSRVLDWVSRLWAPWTTENSVQTDLAMHGHRITRLETKMAQIETALADLDAATNEVAAELDALEQRVANLDEETASRIGAAAARLRGLAADPTDPVPAPPSDGPGAA